MVNQEINGPGAEGFWRRAAEFAGSVVCWVATVTDIDRMSSVMKVGHDSSPPPMGYREMSAAEEAVFDQGVKDAADVYRGRSRVI